VFLINYGIKIDASLCDQIYRLPFPERSGNMEKEFGKEGNKSFSPDPGRKEFQCSNMALLVKISNQNTSSAMESSLSA